MRIVAMLFSHDQSKVVDKWQSLREDDEGLKVAGRLARGVVAAEESLKLASLARPMHELAMDYSRNARRLAKL